MQLESFNRHIRRFDPCSAFLSFALDEFLRAAGRLPDAIGSQLEPLRVSAFILNGNPVAKPTPIFG